MTDSLKLADVAEKNEQIKLYLGEIAIECIALGQRKDETIVEFIRRIAGRPWLTCQTVSQAEASISVYREREAMAEHERYRTRAIDDRSDWPKDGFINDCD